LKSEHYIRALSLPLPHSDTSTTFTGLPQVAISSKFISCLLQYTKCI